MLFLYPAVAQTPPPLKSALNALENRRYGDAIAQTKLVRQPKIADYTAWVAASALFELNDDGGVAEALKPVWAQTPRSPLTGQAALLASRSYVRANQPKSAIEILKRHAGELPQPDGDIALGQAYEAAQEPQNAALSYQHAFYNYPAAAGVDQAETALTRLRDSLGASFPPVTPQTAYARALKLFDARSYKQARRELETLAPSLAGPDRDAALLRIGVAQYNARENPGALQYLRGLQLSGPDADAERLNYIVQCHRRLNNLDQASQTLDQMGRQYPKSRWRLEALLSLASYYTVSNQPAAYEPLFRTCAADFHGDAKAAICHWRLAFAQYLRREVQSASALKDHIRFYPGSEYAASSMYYLGRLAEQAGDGASARAWYDHISSTYPNYYYAALARTRLRDAAIARAQPSQTVVAFLREVTLPVRGRKLDFTANAIVQQRIERARLLAAQSADEFADTELRYGARVDDQPQVLGVALAELALQRHFPERAVRYTKRYIPGSLTLPVDGAPMEFWKLAYPLPYRAPLDTFAKRENLDPFLVAALIRQESEFDTHVMSHAGAYGLTQVMPATGRELARKLKVRPFNAQMLYRPEINLQLGTHYFRSLLDQLDGRLEATLAAYNAGKSRAVSWLSWYEYREPSEFVEMIPFTETRDYVQAVIRNADMYQRLYGGSAK